MSKISQIEAELLVMEQGVFQKLCDAFLFSKYNIHPRSEGGVAGKDKTKTGTPDSFVILSNGNFYFIEYTTQEKGVFSKFLEDLEKCFDEEKTKIPTHKIEKVVLCFNSKLKPDEVNKIIDVCRSKGTEVEFIDLDYLKFELYNYPKLAKDFLNVEPDTEQILRLEDFTDELARKGTAQTNSFFAREEEIEEVIAALSFKDIVVIGGHAGVGKTRIGIEVIKKYLKANEECEALFIHSKGQPLYYDLNDYFLAGRQYIVLVDDANRVGDFIQVARLSISQKFKAKIIVTVRDYALEKIEKQLLSESYDFEKVEIHKLTDDVVKQILQDLKITNPYCVDNITKIADGNPRLVMMSANHVLVDDDCNKLHNVADIYDSFFEPLTSKGELQEEELLVTLGIICFFRIINKSRTDTINEIYEVFDISENDFWESVFRLHEMELVNLYENRIVKISDQVLANYFFYLIYIKKGIIDFSIILVNFLSGSKGKVKESLYPVLTHFGFQKVIEVLAPTLDKELIRIGSAEGELIDFFEVFSFYKPEEILLFIKRKIDQLPESSSTAPYTFRKNKDDHLWAIDRKYPLLKLLKQFGQQPNENFEISLEILFSYIKKESDLLPYVIQYFEGDFLFDQEDYRDRFWRQRTFFNFLYRKIDETDGDELSVGVLYEIAPKFLKSSFQRSKGGRARNSIVMYNVSIHLTSEIQEIRKGILEKIFELFTHYKEETINFFKEYGPQDELNAAKEVYEYDSQFILPFFESSLSASDFKHCLVVYWYFESLKRIKIELAESKSISKFLRNNKLITYKLLTFDYSDWHFEKDESGVDEFYQDKRQRVISHFSSFTLKDYVEFIADMEIYHSASEHGRHTIRESLEMILIHALEKDPENFVTIITQPYLLKNPYYSCSSKVISKMIDKLGHKLVYTTITEKPFEKKETWLLEFFENLPLEAVNSYYGKELLVLFKSLSGHIYLHFEFLKKFKKVDKDIFKKIIKILMDRKDMGKLFPEFYSPNFFEKFTGEIDDDFNLLKRTYFYCFFEKRSPFDGDGKVLKELFQIDRGIITDMIKVVLNKEHSVAYDDRKIGFHFVWEVDDAEEIVDQAIELISSEQRYLGDNKLISSFFALGEPTPKIDTYIRSYIEKNSTKQENLQAIFGVIKSRHPNKRAEYLKELLKHNSDLEMINSLPLANRRASGAVSSFIPFYEKQIEFWESIIPIFSGKVKYLEHKQWVHSNIQHLKNEIAHEIERSFVDDY